MNCDNVFAILTRGPFPSGDRFDRLVEAHLRQCVSCQQLAEALRPNDDFHPEAIAPEDSLALPGYWGGRLHAESRPTVSVTQAANQLRPQPRARPKAPPAYRGINLWQFAAAIVLGILAAAVLRAIIAPTDSTPPGAYPSAVHSSAGGGHPLHSVRPAMCANGTQLLLENRRRGDTEENFYAAPTSAFATDCAACHHPRSMR